MNELKILVVDDDMNICELIGLYLKKEGFLPYYAYDGEQALEKFKSISPDLIILDIMLPKIDGIRVCREIRAESNVPIIMLTAKGETFDKVLGLEMGADDYMVKPFETKELSARIKAVLRRYDTKSGSDAGEVSYPGLYISIANYELKIKDTVIDVPPKELELLYYLASHPNRVFTREQLLGAVWDFDYYGDSRTVDVHVKRLREKLDNTEENWSLKTVWGVGYKFEVKEG